jgi:EAL domain-containing protein (putative c-di-GMP-specific phosphodiesterase class I)/DNA-binding response OmpR family regulator
MTLTRFADASVLVVDDNPANVLLLKSLLARAGLRNVHAYTDPLEAVAQLSDTRPDLALVDLHMPRLDGYGVLAHLTAHAAGAYLPTLVLTADASPQAVQGALGSGARDFLTKPFDGTEVILRVRNLLETRFLHKELRRRNQVLSAQVENYRLVKAPGALDEQHERISQVLRKDAIAVIVQPVFELAGGSVVGVEALARFPAEPVRGPDLWFAEADRVGLGSALEALAVRAALRLLDELPEPLFLAVNVSPAALLSVDSDRGFPAEVCSRLVLELTEHRPVEDYDALHAAANTFRRRGARLAADDAGAGYAGFRHLLALEPDIIKLDLSLTRGVDTDPARRALTSALVQFARDTGARLIAEGVETRPELETLRDLGVGWAQGYHLARPQPLPEALALCRAHPAPQDRPSVPCGRSGQ